MSKTKWYSKLVNLAVGLALVLSLGVAALPTRVSGDTGALGVIVDTDKDTYCCCENVTVTATISATGGNAVNVTGSISWIPDTLTVVGPDPSWGFNITSGESTAVNWTAHCTGPGLTTITVKAKANGVPEVSGETTILQESAELSVNITAPKEEDALFNTCQYFDLEFTITNTGCFNATLVTATITPSDGIEVDDLGSGQPWTTPNLGSLAPGENVTYTKEMHCVDAGDGMIHVLPAGWDMCAEAEISGDYLNSDMIEITQQLKAHLEVIIDEPTAAETYSTCQNFTATARVKNTGDAAANNVTATLGVTGGAKKVSGANPFPLGTIAGGENATATWELHCENTTAATITVTPAGKDDNTGVAIPPDNLTSANVTVEQELKAHLEVTITQPTGVETYSTCQNFTATAIVENTGEATANNVTATVAVIGGAKRVAGDPSQSLGAILGGANKTAEWILHCENTTAATIIVTPAGFDDNTGAAIPGANLTSANVTVQQEEKAHLVVEILSPADGTDILTCQDFAVTALIQNTGEVDALNATATIDPGANASLVAGDNPRSWPIIAGGENKTATWTLHCDKDGAATITVTPEGIDAKTQVAIVPGNLIPGSVVVDQYPAAHLVVDITDYPADPVYVCTTFNVTANITNTGWADAWEVSATLSVFPEGTVRVTEGGYTQDIGTLAGYGQNGTAEVTWTLHCKVACDSTITITAAGRDEFGYHLKQVYIEGIGWVLSMESEPGRAIPDESIEPKSITVKQLEGAVLEVDISWPNYGDEFTQGEEFRVIAIISNISDIDAENVTPSIDIDANASVVTGPTPSEWPKDIPSYDGKVVSWTVNCTAAGWSLIVVSAQGNNTNSDEDAVLVKQLAGPAACEWDNLVVDPTEGVSPLEIDVSADVTNTGAEAIDCTANLKVDSVAVDTPVTVTVAAGATETVTFTDYELCVPGTYDVMINDLGPVSVVVNPQKGDFDADGDIDFDDFVEFGDAYDTVLTDANYNVIGDFDDDDDIDFDDFVLFGDVYGFTC